MPNLPDPVALLNRDTYTRIVTILHTDVASTVQQYLSKRTLVTVMYRSVNVLIMLALVYLWWGKPLLDGLRMIGLGCAL